MRTDVSNAIRFMIRARRRLEGVGATTVRESTALIDALDRLKKQVMASGLRAREGLRREEETNAPS